MKKKRLLTLLGSMCLILVLATLLLPACAQEAAPVTPTPAAPVKEMITWKGQYYLSTTIAPYGPFGAGRAGAGSLQAEYVKWLNAATDGRLVMDVAERGAIFSVTDGLEPIKRGVVDFAFSSGSFILGIIPEANLESLPFTDEDSAQKYDLLYNWGLYDGLKEAYAEHNVNWFPAPTNALVGMATTFPAPDPEALKGKKIRGVGAMGAYIAMLGGSPVSFPWGEAYMGMKLGTVDGFIGGSGILEEQKLKEVVKYFIMPPVPYRAQVNMLINQDSFNALPEDIREIIERESRYVFAAIAFGWEQQCQWALVQAEKEYGVQVISWSEEDIRKVRELAMENIWKDVAAKSERTARLVDIAERQLREYGRIK